jgi:hypothetical protein
MATGVTAWSTNAANNGTADSNMNWAEGMAPSQVDDSARALMASVALYRNDHSGALVTSGSSTAYTVTSNQGFASLSALGGNDLTIQFHTLNGTAPTLAVDGLAAEPIQVDDNGTAVSSGVIGTKSIWAVTYDNSASAFVLRSVAATLQSSTVGTPSIANSAVTYAKIQNESANTLLGNPTGSGAAPSEITLGTGLTFSGTSITAPQFPPTAAFKNLSIKVTGGSTLQASADYVTVATSGSSAFQTLAFPQASIDLANAGSVNQLDSGTLSGPQPYAVWSIATAAGTAVGFIVSASFTAPTMPSGYTYKARVGALITSTSTAGQLMGTYQFGRDVQYIVGLAGTGTTGSLPRIISGTQTAWTATAVTTKFVPSTASVINVMLSAGSGSGNVQAAPNNSYSTTINSTSNPAPLVFNASGAINIMGSLVLESANIYYGATDGQGGMWCTGWRDNI